METNIKVGDVMDFDGLSITFLASFGLRITVVMISYFGYVI